MKSDALRRHTAVSGTFLPDRARVGRRHGSADSPREHRRISGGVAARAAALGAAIAFLLLLLSGCAGGPKPVEPAQAAAPPSSAQTGSNGGTEQLRLQLAQTEAAQQTLQSQLESAKQQLGQVEQKNQALSSDNEKLREVLARVAFDRGVPEEQLLRSADGGATAAGSTGVPATAGPSSGLDAGHPSLASSSLIVDNVDPATGIHTLVDMRANASSGNVLFASISLKDGDTPVPHLTIQHRYPQSDSPFLVRAVTVVVNGSAVPLPLDRFTITRYRTGPFRVEAVTTQDPSLIESLLTAVLDGNGAVTADADRVGSPSGAATPELPEVIVRETGVQKEYTRRLTRDEIDALANMVYAYRELGGTAP